LEQRTTSKRKRGKIEIQLKGWAIVSSIPIYSFILFNGRPLYCFSRSNVKRMLKVCFNSNAAQHLSLKQIEESTDQWIQLYFGYCVLCHSTAQRMLNHSVQRTSNSATNETDEIAKGASIAFDSRYHPSLLAIPPRHANSVPFEGGAAVAGTFRSLVDYPRPLIAFLAGPA
jgi:hypothetical protein